MPGLAETLKDLTSRTLAGLQTPAGGPSRLAEVAFAPNPGNLRMWQYRPAGLSPGAPLVVALHGCTQNAAAYDTGAGWSQLADRAGFAVLCPEQVSSNNAQNCFNWFEPGDTTRGHGEVASIAAMVTHMLATGGLDKTKVFVTGLSAGGAMTASLLACYPDMFAAGAIVAGLPFGVAGNMQEALGAMFRSQGEPGPASGGRVRAAGPPGYRGPWPRVSVWHGTADHTVKPVNAGESVKQWLDVHGAGGPGVAEQMEGASRTVWRDRAGAALVEQVMVPGLGHGVPIAPAASGIGSPGPFMLAADVSSTEEIARFFGMKFSAGRQAAPQAPPKPAAEGRLLSKLLAGKLEPLRILPRPFGR